MTADGTLITNCAAGTFQSSAGKLWLVSYCATAWVYVQNPNMIIWKTVTPTVQAAGGNVTFTICAKNTSAAVSAFNVTVTDRMPDGMSYQGGYTEWPAAWVDSYNNTANGSGTNGQPAVGALNPLFLKWTMPALGPMASGCVTYAARVL